MKNESFAHLTTKPTYNGWTNYATWRISLELFQDHTNEYNLDAYALHKQLKNIAEELIDCNCHGLCLQRDYAMAFLDEVNFYEIAEHIIDNTKND
jgi:hypothetical protein